MLPHKHNPPAVSPSHALSQFGSISALLKVLASVPFKGAATEEVSATTLAACPSRAKLIPH
jgi:hypothetical protein